MNDDTWECMSPEQAFSGELYRPPPNCTLDSLVFGIASAANEEYPFAHHPSNAEKTSPKLHIDATQNRKGEKKVKFAKTKTVITDGAMKRVDDEGLLTFDQALCDVRKFSITGYKGDEKDAAKVQLAVKLGAKRQKRKAVNYNELKEQLKQKRTERREQREIRRKEGVLNKKKLGKIKKKSKKRRK